MSGNLPEADHGSTAAEIAQKYGTANLTRVMTGGYIESLSFLPLLAALVFASNVIGQRTESAGGPRPRQPSGNVESRKTGTWWRANHVKESRLPS
jgi:hypothetical protein